MRLVQQAHALLREHIGAGDTVIDATVGNAHDTEFLAQTVGPTGKVFGFDIQTKAIQNAQAKLQQLDLASQVTLYAASHDEMHAHIPEKYHGQICAVMFNLGYLPGADKGVVTQATTTISALSAASKLLAPRAVMSILAYPGHPGGADEVRQVRGWVDVLPKDEWSVQRFQPGLKPLESPELLYLQKRRAYSS